MGGCAGLRLLDGYQTLVETMRSRYSPRSHSVVVAMMEWLHALHEQALACPDDIAELEMATASVVADIRRCYELAQPRPAPLPRRIADGDPPLYVFDRACYLDRYGSRSFAVMDIATEVPADAFTAVEAGRTYLYVVDDRYRLLVCRTPLTVDDLLQQRNPRIEGMEIFHPMLVPERLTVVAAGEIAFFGHHTVQSIAANLKSGHFRPAAPSIQWLGAWLRARFPELRLLTLIPVEVGAGLLSGASTASQAGR